MNPRKPVFLERNNYHRRRMMDAVRLLPILALGLWMVPLLWGLPDESEPAAHSMSSALTYVFGIWVLVALAGIALWWRTGARTATGAEDGPR